MFVYGMYIMVACCCFSAVVATLQINNLISQTYAFSAMLSNSLCVVIK